MVNIVNRTGLPRPLEREVFVKRTRESRVLTVEEPKQRAHYVADLL